MKPYIVCTGQNNICRCSFDLLIKSPQNQLVLLSLIDHPTIVKKAVADVRDSYSGVQYGDYEQPGVESRFYSRSFIDGKNNLFSKGERIEALSHVIIRSQSETQNCIINWENRPLITLLNDWLMNAHQIPITPKLLEAIYNMDNSIVQECEIITCNPAFKDLKAYQPNVELIRSYLTDPSIYKNLDILRKKEDVDWSKINSIEDYVLHFLDTIVDTVRPKITALYNPTKLDKTIFRGKYMPYVGQVPAIQSAIEVLSQKKEKFVYLASEQGTGKTPMTVKILNGYFPRVQKKTPVTLMLVPSTTITQWQEEIKDHFYTKNVNVVVIKKTSEFIRLYEQTKFKFDKPTFIICGKETFKLEYQLTPAIMTGRRKVNDRYCASDVVICPDCGQVVKNVYRTSDDVFLSLSDFKNSEGKWKRTKANSQCSNCKASLWSATYGKTKKTSVIDFISKRHIVFDMAVVDECQESNNFSSILGTATGRLWRNHAKKSICLSGTPNNGKCSSLYNVLLSFLPRTLHENNIYSVKDFIAQYGTLEAVSTKDEDKETYMTCGRARLKESEYREVEGVNPVAFVKFLAKNYIFMELKDLGKDLPPLTEEYISIEPSKELYDSTRTLLSKMKEINTFSAAFKEDTVVKHYLNCPFDWKAVAISGREGVCYVQPYNFDNPDELFPKEEILLDIIQKEKAQNRKCWIYVDFNHGGKYRTGLSLPERLKEILNKHHIKAYILPTGDPTKRKDLIVKNTPKYDVFISNRKLVAVGLNLQAFTTFINYTPSYKVNDVEQANRRGWRANSTQPNKVYHLYYTAETEARVMRRYQRKKAESNAIQGKFNIVLENETVRTQSAFGKTISNNMASFVEPLPDISEFINQAEIMDYEIRRRQNQELIQVVSLDVKTCSKSDMPKRVQKIAVDGQMSLII